MTHYVVQVVEWVADEAPYEESWEVARIDEAMEGASDLRSRARCAIEEEENVRSHGCVWEGFSKDMEENWEVDDHDLCLLKEGRDGRKKGGLRS